MRYDTTTLPQDEALSLQAVKEHLRLDHNDDDDALSQLITVARQYFERTYSMALIEQTVTLWLDKWPVGGKSEWWGDDPTSSVSLPVRPIINISHIFIYNKDDKETLWGDNCYRSTGGLEPRLIKRDNMEWPVPGRETDGVEITYQAGFGKTANDVPLLIQHGIKEMVAQLYTNRGDDLKTAALVSGATTLWAPYKRVKL